MTSFGGNCNKSIGTAAKSSLKHQNSFNSTLRSPVNSSSASSKSKPPALSSSSSSLRRSASKDHHNHHAGGVPGRVRVAVRLRPRNAEELIADADFADCVELQPELKRLKLRKNNWDMDTYEFDEVLEFASQKRVYGVVAEPVVESVLDGYNGTVMAYGQTGTGKTYTLGRLGEEDTAARGIMVRAMEDILADINPEADSVSVSYLQVHVRRTGNGRDSFSSSQNGDVSHLVKNHKLATLRKSKLVVVDLAGSERIDKSGSDGHTLEEAK